MGRDPGGTVLGVPIGKLGGRGYARYGQGRKTAYKPNAAVLGPLPWPSRPTTRQPRSTATNGSAPTLTRGEGRHPSGARLAPRQGGGRGAAGGRDHGWLVARNEKAKCYQDCPSIWMRVKYLQPNRNPRFSSLPPGAYRHQGRLPRLPTGAGKGKEQGLLARPS